MADTLTDQKFLLSLTRLPMRARRRALRLIWQAQRLTGKLQPLGLEKMLTYAIRVSRAEAARIDDEAQFQDWLVTLEWASLLRRSKAAAMRDFAAIHFDNTDLLAHLSHTRKPLIFTPLHMGAFALPLAKLMHDHFAGRRMLVLRAREDREDETRAMERISEIGVDVRFLNVANKQNFLDAIRFAKAGAVIVTFVDLPASYGSPADVTLFGKPARLAMGLPALARITGAQIVPMSVQSTIAGDTVRFGRPFESFVSGETEKMRVANIVRRHIEDAILAAPEQWHMWARFNEYVDFDFHSEAA